MAVRVGVDTSPLVQTRAGTARHVRGLLSALRGRPDLDLELLSFGGPGRASSVTRDALWYPIAFGRRARSLDVLHCTTFRGPAGAGVPTVLTVHDLAIIRAPEVFPRWHRLYGRFGLERVLRAADAIVAVSEFSRAETIELAGVPEERIRVVPHGVDPVFTPDGPRAEGEYVLAVATLEPRKNLARAVDAAREAGVELRVVGARGWGGVDVQGWVGEVPDAELAALYRGARCVLYPSLYEGFGLPVLEAMACGTPVVTSLATAMEEVAGGAAVLVDPLDVSAIAAGIDDALHRRDELVPAGLARAHEFTWPRTADAVVELWSELA
jgi:glycosyltransferase involved in cell wall biosynthesis